MNEWGNSESLKYSMSQQFLKLTQKRNRIRSFAETQINLEAVIQSEVSQKEKSKYSIQTHISRIQESGMDDLIYKAEVETQTQRTIVWMPRGKGGMQDELGDWG